MVQVREPTKIEPWLRVRAFTVLAFGLTARGGPALLLLDRAWAPHGRNKRAAGLAGLVLAGRPAGEALRALAVGGAGRVSAGGADARVRTGGSHPLGKALGPRARPLLRERTMVCTHTHTHTARWLWLWLWRRRRPTRAQSWSPALGSRFALATRAQAPVSAVCKRHYARQPFGRRRRRKGQKLNRDTGKQFAQPVFIILLFAIQ